ncbi:MAG TPA: hypothetical protein DD422_08860 [Akkermansia sp.]|nr:hypothetical protein [Akkermansia sp.]HBN18148.1 hypothetical protein [Akkermansia sp.]
MGQIKIKAPAAARKRCGPEQWGKREFSAHGKKKMKRIFVLMEFNRAGKDETKIELPSEEKVFLCPSH